MTPPLTEEERAFRRMLYARDRREYEAWARAELKAWTKKHPVPVQAPVSQKGKR